MFDLFKRNSKTPDESEDSELISKDLIQEIPPAVKQGFILVCEKCGVKLSQGEAENPSRVFQKTLKSAIQKFFGRKIIRPILTGCLDNCPEGKIAVGIVPLDKSKKAVFLEVKPKNYEDSAAQIIEMIESR